MPLINGLTLFDRWAPPEWEWSAWAKPVLFAEMDQRRRQPAPFDLPEIAFASPSATAYVVDLPEAEAVAAGVAAAHAGYWPVPLFNLTGLNRNRRTIDPDEIADALIYGAVLLPDRAPTAETRPAFLVDDKRMRKRLRLRPGVYDNRWLVFPQDFPSAHRLQRAGITQVVLLTADHTPDTDLAHILFRWQKAGLTIARQRKDAPEPTPVKVRRPSHFGLLWYRLLAIAGLRPNSTGGFGALVPEESSGSGFG
jgi:hypothetical protein